MLCFLWKYIYFGLSLWCLNFSIGKKITLWDKITFFISVSHNCEKNMYSQKSTWKVIQMLHMFQSKTIAWYYGCLGSLGKFLLDSNEQFCCLKSCSKIFIHFCEKNIDFVKKLQLCQTSTFSTIYSFPWKIFMPILRENYLEKVIFKNEGAVIFLQKISCFSFSNVYIAHHSQYSVK